MVALHEVGQASHDEELGHWDGKELRFYLRGQDEFRDSL